MEMLIEDTILMEDKILKTNESIVKEKENKLVNLIVEIIVSVTLKEYYEKSD
jgi:hypothetical protein